MLNYLIGVYEKSVKLFHIWIGMTIGTIAISTLYGFFPNEWRSSRGIILFTFLIGATLMSVFRLILAWRKGTIKQLFYSLQNLIIVGSYDESKRIIELLNEISVKRNYLGFISPNSQDVGNTLCIGTLDKINEILHIENVDEIIFCAKDISSLEIIAQIASINKEINFKIAAAEGDAIIGSHSKDSSGELLTYDVGFRINKSYLRRLKRFTDVFVSMLTLVTSPVLIWIQKNKLGFLKNIFWVVIGKKTWVSYSERGSVHAQIPVLAKGVLSPIDNLYVDQKSLTKVFIDRQNYLYAKDYSVLTDLQTIFNSVNSLGN